MTETMWVRHAVTEAIGEIPRDALAIYRQSGWELMSDEDVADMHAKAEADRLAAAPEVLDGSAAAEVAELAVAEPAAAADPISDVPTPEDAGKRRTAKTKES